MSPSVAELAMVADCFGLGMCECQAHALSLGAMETTLGITCDSRGPGLAPALPSEIR